MFLKENVLVEQGIIHAAKALNSCYSNLHQHVYNKSDMAKSKTNVFKVIPKQHLFQELCEMSDINPSMTWCYRDEDFGGSLASISRVRGGSNRASNVCKAVLLKFVAQHRLPRL